MVLFFRQIILYIVLLHSETFWSIPLTVWDINLSFGHLCEILALFGNQAEFSYTRATNTLIRSCDLLGNKYEVVCVPVQLINTKIAVSCRFGSYPVLIGPRVRPVPELVIWGGCTRPWEMSGMMYQQTAGESTGESMRNRNERDEGGIRKCALIGICYFCDLILKLNQFA